MKKTPKDHKRVNSLQAIIDYLSTNGLSDFDINILIHTNLPALGERRTIVDCTRNNEWDDAWNVVELYIAGDLW
jgi:hypothetical protein